MSKDYIFAAKYSNTRCVIIEYPKTQPGLCYGIMKIDACKDQNDINGFTRISMDSFSSCGSVRFIGSYNECLKNFTKLSLNKFKENQYFPLFTKNKDDSLSSNQSGFTSVMESFENKFGMSAYDFISKDKIIH